MEGSMHSESASMSRRRPRESETESQKIKREKAAERQRRKRERDRKNAVALQQQQQQQQAAVAAQQQIQQQQQQQQPPPTPQQQQQQPQGAYTGQQDLTPEEIDRRDRVRAAARERQRKHRLLVKERRMRDLGLDMGNEIIPGMEEVHYRATADGQYHQVMAPEMQIAPPHPPMPHHEPPFPQGAPLGGQTFASTLLLSFSCAPLLKQHLLRTLGMSNEELASLEPIIAEAWDRWDHQRRLHYAEQVAKNGGQPPGMPPPYGVDMSQHDPSAPPPHPFPHPNGPGPTDPTQAAVNDFRARFHRSIIAPAPFRTNFGDSQPTSTATPSSASGSTPADAIDPHLATNSNGAATTATKS